MSSEYVGPALLNCTVGDPHLLSFTVGWAPFTEGLYSRVIPITELYCRVIPFTEELYWRVIPFTELHCRVIPIYWQRHLLRSFLWTGQIKQRIFFLSPSKRVKDWVSLSGTEWGIHCACQSPNTLHASIGRWSRRRKIRRNEMLCSGDGIHGRGWLSLPVMRILILCGSYGALRSHWQRKSNWDLRIL